MENIKCFYIRIMEERLRKLSYLKRVFLEKRKWGRYNIKMLSNFF